MSSIEASLSDMRAVEFIIVFDYNLNKIYMFILVIYFISFLIIIILNCDTSYK